MAGEDFQGGQDWDPFRKDVIRNSKGILLIVTELAPESNEVERELGLAHEFGKTIIPCRKTGVQDSTYAELPEFVTPLHHISFGDKYDLAEGVIKRLRSKTTSPIHVESSETVRPLSSSGPGPSWRDLQIEFGPLEVSPRLKSLDSNLKDYWAKNHSMRLAHGYSHHIQVARTCLEMAEEIKPADLNVKSDVTFAAGMLHDIYRYIGGGSGGMDRHSEKSAEEAGHILRDDKLFDDNEIESIKEAIRNHSLVDDSNEARRTTPKTAISKILFVADKSHMSIERVMGYIYDYTKGGAKSEAWISRGYPGQEFMDVVTDEFAVRIASLIGAFRDIKDGRFADYISRAVGAHMNTMQELESQRVKVRRNEDSELTVLLFWAFKEAISNFRYLVYSERNIQRREGDLWGRIEQIMAGAGRRDSVDYNTLLLQQLGKEPFGEMMEYRAWHLIPKK